MKMKVESVPLASLKPYDNNAKKHTREQIEAVESSIREFGFRNPIIAWHNEDGVAEIVAGHARAKAAANIGMEEVPVVFCDDLTDAQRRALTLADNQTTMMTGWDDDMLAYELDTLAQDFDMGDFGFDDSMLGDSALDPDGIEEIEPDEDAEDRVKLGEVWRMGDHVLLCGDATKPENIAKLLESIGGGLCDLLLTDPPYNIAYEGKTADQLRIENDSWGDDEGFVRFLSAAFGSALSAMAPGAAFYIWHADMQQANMMEACKRCGMTVRELLIWAKSTFALGRQDYQWRHEACLYGWKDGASHSWYSDRKQSTVLEFDKPASNAEHPTMKPVALMAYLVHNSTKEGDIVLDTFGGSGSTLVACEQIGRRCLTMELDPHYASVIVDRWERLTHRDAVKVA